MEKEKQTPEAEEKKDEKKSVSVVVKMETLGIKVTQHVPGKKNG